MKDTISEFLVGLVIGLFPVFGGITAGVLSTKTSFGTPILVGASIAQVILIDRIAT